MRNSYIGMPELVFSEIDSHSLLNYFLRTSKNLLTIIKKISRWERENRAQRRSYFLRMNLNDAIDKIPLPELIHMKGDMHTRTFDILKSHPNLMKKHALDELNKDDELFVVERELGILVKLLSDGKIINKKLKLYRENLKIFTIEQAMKEKYRWFDSIYFDKNISVFAADIKLTIKCLDEVIKRNESGDFDNKELLQKILTIDSEVKNIYSMIENYRSNIYGANKVGHLFGDLDSLYGDDKHYFILDLVKGWNEKLTDEIAYYHEVQDQFYSIGSLSLDIIKRSKFRYKDPELIEVFFNSFNLQIKSVYKIVRNQDYVFFFNDIKSFVNDVLKFQEKYYLLNLVDMKFGNYERFLAKNDNLLNLILHFSKVIGEICYEVRIFENYLYLNYGEERIRFFQEEIKILQESIEINP
jgi:hypothetical protein